MSSISRGRPSLSRLKWPEALVRAGHSRWLPLTLAGIAVVWAIGTYVALTDDQFSADTESISFLVIGNLVVLLALALLITRRL
ncbi:MAG: hypothetical protein R3360_08590, partial [Alphaproteobacteria bacterium]|nr:hypothetical protein [Alphaproteobacteria bacterium]